MATSHDTSRANVALRINYAPTKETLDDNGPGGREEEGKEYQLASHLGFRNAR